MWDKIKNFFKKIWWVVLVPVGILLFHLIFRKETPELDRLIKDKKKEIENNGDKIVSVVLTRALNDEIEYREEDGKEE